LLYIWGFVAYKVNSRHFFQLSVQTSVVVVFIVFRDLVDWWLGSFEGSLLLLVKLCELPNTFSPFLPGKVEHTCLPLWLHHKIDKKNTGATVYCTQQKRRHYLEARHEQGEMLSNTASVKNYILVFLLKHSCHYWLVAAWKNLEGR
jgi:hypothetical protein